MMALEQIVDTETIPPIMLNPDLLAPGEPWEHTCRLVITGHDRQGVHRTMFCSVRTQGGRAGLAAHQRVVHGIEP